ncbi:DMT family transporter [Methylobacterium oryzisoli]|uniref:DMT family transporter n=1 Tax=Methylobacterium oryzisoli TaxID=3385502 RepID=UPI003892274B
MEALFVAAALGAGALLPVQAGANAQLSRAVGSPFGATALQLGVGSGLLLLVALLTGTLAALAGLPRVPWWHAAGGTASAFYVVSTLLLFPRLGAVVTVGLLIAGQMLASLALDTFGLLGVAAKPATAVALSGTLAVLAGAALIVRGQEGVGVGAGAAARSPERPGWTALALAAGAVLPVQGAVNGLLRRDLGAPFAVGAVSFLVATLAMAGVLLLATALLRQPRPRLAGLHAMPWWGWLGGVAGAAYVTTVFTAIPVIGTAGAVGLTVAGQQAASVLVDRYGWFRLPRRPVSGLRLAGVAVLLAGVAALALA